MSMIFMAKNGMGGRVRLAFLISILLAVSLMWGSVLAGEFRADITPSTQEATGSDFQVEFNITNENSVQEIEVVNITVPSGAVFVDGSNQTSGDWLFSNGTDYLLWENTSITGVINVSEYKSFYANLTFSTVPGNYTFNVSVWHDYGQLNYSDHNVTIQDTTPPSGITLVSHLNGTWTNQSSMLLTINYNELNPDNCTYYQNSTYNISNSTTSSPCYIYLDSYSQGILTFTLIANDTSRNSASNGTYSLGYDSAVPYGNSLGIFLPGGENVSGGNISQLVNVTISANVTDSLSGINTSINDSVYARIFNSTGGLFATINLTHDSGNIFNGTWDTGSCVGGDNYTINVTAADLAGNTETVLTTTLNITETPDLAVSGLEWSSSNALPGWPHSGDEIYLNITVSNLGTGNFSNDFNLTVSVDGSEEFRTLLDNSSLDSGESHEINATIASGNFSANGLYTFTIELDPDDVVDETCETNNTRNLFLTIGYNVSLYLFNGVAFPSLGAAYPDRNVSVNYTVTGANGTGVAGLGEGDFIFYSKWGSNDYNVSERVHEWKDDGSGNYSFRFSTQGLFESGDDTRARFGDNHLNITAANGSWSGKGILPYNITAPSLDVSIQEVDDLDDIDLQGSASKEVEFNVTLENTGNAIAYDIQIDDGNGNDYGETNWVGNDDMEFQHSGVEMNLDPGEEFEFTVELTVDDEMEDEYFYLYVSYNDTLGNRGYNSTDEERVTVTDTGTPAEEETTTGTTGTTPSQSVDLELTLMDWPDTINGYSGEDNTTSVEVKNTGDVSAVAKVSLTCDPVESVTVSPLSKNLAVGDRQEFFLDVNFAEDAEIGEYDCTLKAYVSSSEDDYDSETVTVQILPTTEQEVEIRDRYENISAEVQALLDRFALINQEVVGEENYSRVKTVIDNLNSSMQEAQEAIDSEDFLTANELLTTLQASLEIADQNLGRLETEQTLGGGLALSGTWYLVIIIIVVVIAVAFVAYLMFPQKQGFGPRKGLLESITSSIKGGGSGLNNIKDSGKDRLSGIAEKGRNLAPQQSGYSYSQQGGIGSKLKSVVQKIKDKLKREKKPQKEVTQYFVNSSNKLINFT